MGRGDSGSMETLEQYKIGMNTIEAAFKNGLILTPNGKDIDIKARSKDYDKDQLNIIIKSLNNNKAEVKAIATDPEGLKQTLCKAQEGLFRINERCWVLLDSIDRLERIYRALYPHDLTCIHGESKCPDDAVMICSACAKESPDLSIHIPDEDEL